MLREKTILRERERDDGKKEDSVKGEKERKRGKTILRENKKRPC